MDAVKALVAIKAFYEMSKLAGEGKSTNQQQA